MTTEQQQAKLRETEAFVRRVLSNDLHQKAPASTVKDVAAKVVRAVQVDEQPKQRQKAGA